MSTVNISRRYASALFELNQDSAIDLVALNQAGAVVINEDAARVISSPVHKQTLKADMVKKAIKSSNKDVVSRLIDLLAARDKLTLLPEIDAQLTLMIAASQSQVEVEVTVATKLSAKDKSRLATVLKEIANSEVKLNVHQDASILGGVVIQMGDRKIDCSIRGKLDHLRQAIAN